MFNYLIQSYLYGIKESYSPYALATLLFFILYLSVVGVTYRKIVIQGMSFLIIAGASYAGISAGVFDEIIFQKRMIHFFEYFYLGVGLLFVLFAFLNFLDWVDLRLKKKTLDSLWVKLPAFWSLSSNQIEAKKSFLKRINNTYFIFLGHFVVFCLIFAQSIWPVDVFIYRIYAIFLAEGYQKYIYLFFCVYAGGYLSLLIVSWIGLLIFAKRNNTKRDLSIDRVSTFKIIVSALFLSVGVGMIYLYII